MIEPFKKLMTDPPAVPPIGNRPPSREKLVLAMQMLIVATTDLCDDCERVAKASYDMHSGTALADWKEGDPEGYVLVQVARERIEFANRVLRGGS